MVKIIAAVRSVFMETLKMVEDETDFHIVMKRLSQSQFLNAANHPHSDEDPLSLMALSHNKPPSLYL